MPGFLIGLICFGTIFAVNLLLIILATLVRLVPTALPGAARIIWALLLLTRGLYVRVLTVVAPPIRRALSIDLERQPWRLGVTCFLSFGVGCLLLYLLGWGLSVWTGLLFLGHGVFIDVTWNETFEGGGIEMGERMPWNH
jgi:hypothetical protein